MSLIAALAKGAAGDWEVCFWAGVGDEAVLFKGQIPTDMQLACGKELARMVLNGELAIPKKTPKGKPRA